MAEEEYVQKNIRFPQSLWDRVEKTLPEKANRSEFVRKAVEDALRPLETEARIKALEERLGEL